MMSEQDVLDRLRTAIAAGGSQRAFARQHRLSEQYLSDVLRGRREMGQGILDALGVERVVAYREKPVGPTVGSTSRERHK